MCIAIYKPIGAAFPSRRTLERCFYANPDGAGYMYAAEHIVQIRKGFTAFKPFWKSLREARATVGDSAAFVLHFRISTQAGTRPDCTHPFPLSRKMDDLRKLSCSCNVGIAHNGIISHCSAGIYKTVTHSDTMEFITEYAARLIRRRRDLEDPDILAVLAGIADSRLAILDGSGKCTLLGSGWLEDGGCFYSNKSYLPAPPKPALPPAYDYYMDTYRSYWSTVSPAPATVPDPDPDPAASSDPYAEYLDTATGLYNFDELDCPATSEGDISFCEHCTRFGRCFSC